MVAGVWALLIGTGLGSTALVALGAVCFVIAAGVRRAGRGGAVRRGQPGHGAGRRDALSVPLPPAAQHPPINEAAPATFDALLAVIRRAQYPPRTPLDDPTVPSGGGNPGGRSR